jgi:hypothetical protein
LASAIDTNKVSNVGQDGIPLQGGNTHNWLELGV